MDELLENYLHKTREFLEEIIDPDFGLIDKMRAKSVLNVREMEKIKAKDTRIGRNSLLLDIISRNKKISELCEALKDAGQQHIANYLNSCGVRSPQFDEDWPLTQRELSILESNHEAFIDILDTCDLIGRLYSGGVINRRHVEFISSRSASYEKSEALLEIIRRCSLRSYVQTIKCLRESNQSHIAEILETGGALVPFHATLESDNLDETETRIVNAMTNLLLQENVSQEQSSRLLAATQLNIIAIRRGQSVVLYSWCRREDELDRLCKIIDDLEIKDVLEQLFNLLIYNIKIKVLSVKILESDVTKARQLLKIFPHIFDESLVTIDEQRGADGVTKLRNEFYCLYCDGEMKVFCDRYPFVLLRKFQLKEIERANDIVSCEIENALYVLVIHWGSHVCVWKIKQSSKTNQSEIKWLELSDHFRPKTLSMSKNGQLLMVGREPSPSLRIYGSDAHLRQSISLHQNIQWPIHAVETSTGNFVILHFLEEKKESTITTLSRDGKAILHNFQPGNEKQRLSGFGDRYLSIDSNNRVFVADYYNNRVILLDSNLRWNQILFPKNEGTDEDSGKKNRPSRLYYDEGKKQIVVCGFYEVQIVFLK